MNFEFSYRHVTRPILLSSTAQILRTKSTAYRVSNREKVVAECEKDYWTFGVTKPGWFNPKREQSEKSRQETEPGPSDHPPFRKLLVFRSVISIGSTPRGASHLKLIKKKKYFRFLKLKIQINQSIPIIIII